MDRSRLTAFTDAVVAVLITIMVLAASNGKKPAIRKGAEESGGGAFADALRHASEKSNGGKTRT